MKPPFNIPGRYQFFQDGENKEEEANRDANTNFKVSWFEEQVDTFISRRIVSNYQVYNYQQGAPKEPPCRDGKQPANSATDESVQLEKQMLTFPEEEIDKDILSKFLENLFTYNMDKLMAGTSSRNIDLRPCEVITGVGGTVSNQNVEECREKCSKSYYDASEESPEGSGDVVPLNALEMFIKNAMDDSLAKFKEEINKAIDNKFESLRTIPQSATSLSAGDGEAKLFACENSSESPHYTLGNTELGDKIRDSLTADMAHLYESSKDRGCQIFNLIRPEVRNVIFGHDSASFQSESINVIKKNISNLSMIKEVKSGLNEGSKISDSEKLENDVAVHLSKVLNDTSLVEDTVKNNKDKQKEESGTLIVAGNCKQVVPGCDDLSENCIAEAIKKSANPKLMTDMTKFMYIIFESFRRLKEENLRRELGSCSGSESINSSCESKTGDEPVIPKEEVTSDVDQTKEETEKNILSSSCKNVKPVMLTIVETPDFITDQVPSSTNGFPGKFSRDERPIISLTGGMDPCEDKSMPTIKDPTCVIEKSEPVSLVDINEDSGYAVQKFKKNNIGYKPTKSSKVLENLKELYLQNLNNIEQKIVSSYTVGDKYKCQIKKKFSPAESRFGTRLDSKFYCNLRTKPTENRNSSEISMRRMNSRIRSKGSSNIISVRHSLIKSRNRSTFKSVSKKREISLDSTVISLLDISLKNKSSWLKKLSSLSSETSSEEEKVEEKANLLKRLCLITFTWGKKHNISHLMDQHLSNIYNAICLDFVTDDVYKSVLYVSDQLRSGSQQNKDEIMRRWVKICNKPLAKEKKSFNLECLHQIWVQFRTKIWHLARPPPIIPPNFFPALTYPSEENRLIKEQVIQKYARDILEYISDPKLYKHSVSLYSNDSIIL